MEYIGVIGFVLALVSLSALRRVTALERQVRKLKKGKTGEPTMSHIIQSLTGACCKLHIGDFSDINKATILEVDDEWVRLSYPDKKGQTKTEILRIDEISRIEVLAEPAGSES